MVKQTTMIFVVVAATLLTAAVSTALYAASSAMAQMSMSVSNSISAFNPNSKYDLLVVKSQFIIVKPWMNSVETMRFDSLGPVNENETFVTIN